MQLVLPDVQDHNQQREDDANGRVVNVASVPHRSPFRYPGGKTWLVPFVRQWLARMPSKPVVFCEPFCGGANVALSVLFDGLVEQVLLVELDEDVAAVWETVLDGQAEELIRRIGEFDVSSESVRALLSWPPRTILDRAFATIVRNRVQRGGILAPGASLMKLGENGRGLKSRWYPATLQRRISDIAAKKDKITFVQGDGIAYMRKTGKRAGVVYFVDPPYTVAGRRLYLHSEIDHEELFQVVATVEGEFLITYDDAEPIRQLAKRRGFDVLSFPMKNTHHRIMHELIIGRDLSWA